MTRQFAGTPCRRTNKGELVNISSDGWRRAARRLLLGGVIGAGVVLAMSQSASAATTATFTNGTLSIMGDGADNNIEITRNAAGVILVNGGAIPVRGGIPTVSNTSLIRSSVSAATTASRSTRPTVRSLGRARSAAPATTR
jgi:hypothetical protein